MQNDSVKMDIIWNYLLPNFTMLKLSQQKYEDLAIQKQAQLLYIFMLFYF